MKSFLVFIFFLVFWCSIFIGSGSVFSGYHFADDHEILRIHGDIIAQNNIIEVGKKWMKADFTFRFKPFYFIHRVVEARIFGANFTLWLTYTGLLAVFTSFFLFLFFKKIGFSLLESIVFPLLSLAGLQSVIWFSLGPNETIGMFCMSLSLLFMGYSIYSEKGKFIYGLLFIFFAILMSLSKESFILIIPAILFWMIWLYKEKNGVSFFGSIKRNIGTIVTLLLVMSVELFIIVQWIGTGGYGAHGGGLDGFNLLLYLRTAKDMTFSLSTVGIGLVIIPCVLLMIFNGTDDNLYVRVKRFFKDFYCAIILMALIAFPQFVIYARSGVFGRYILPLILAYSIFLLYVIKFLRTNDKQYFIKLPDRGLKMIYLSCSILGLSLLVAGFVLLYNQDMSRLLFSVLGKSPRKEYMDDILKPGILGTASGIFIISMGWIIAKVKNRARRLPVLNIAVSLAIAFLVYKTMLTFAVAYEFAVQGKNVNSVFKSVESHTDSRDVILIVTDPDINYNEAGWSIKVYLNHVSKRGNIYVYPMFVKDADKAEMERMAGNYERMFEGKSLSNIENKSGIKYIIVFKELEQKFLNTSKEWFDSSNFAREANGFLITYYKNI